MEMEFADAKLTRLYTEKGFTAGLSLALVKGFRKTTQAISAAVDERDLYARPALRFERLAGKRQHEHSLRLNDQYRLIVELTGAAPNKIVLVKKIEDYH